VSGRRRARAIGVKRPHALLVAAACCTLHAALAPLCAQDVAAPVDRGTYASVTVALSGTHQVSSGRLEDYWDAGNGIRFDVHMPFHVGEAGISATTLRYETRSADQPGFRAILIGASWRFPLVGGRRVRPSLSLEAGNFMTIYDGEQPKGLGKESEIYVGGGASLAVMVAGGTSLVLGADARHVFTSTPVRLTSARAGVAHTFGTPRWLRAVIE
jgi:hypothetical protein